MTGSSAGRVAPPASVLYESPNLRVRHIPAPVASSLVVVSFAPWRTVQSLDHEGFGEAFLAGLGVDAVLVTCASNAWYQYQDMPLALARIAAATGSHRRRVGYGSSMGAFAAIAFSGVLRLDAILALSPQYAIDPVVVPFETRWRREAASIRWMYGIDQGISPTAECIVAYDNLHLDRRHVDLLERIRPVTSLRLPFSGHPVGEFLKEAGLLSQVAGALIRDQTTMAALRTEVRQARTGSARYWHELARALEKRGQLREALAAMMRATMLAPRRAGYFHAQGHLALALGEADLAVQGFARSAELQPLRAEAHFALAKSLMRVARHAQALAAVDTAIALAPQDGRPRSFKELIMRRMSG